MKTKNILLGIVLLLTIVFCPSLSAQKNLNAIIKKCENKENVEVNLIQQKNRETKELEKRIVTITFKNDENLLNEIIDAFHKDKEDAVKVIEEKKNGRIMPSLYEFYDKKNTLKFSINISKNGEVNFSLIERSNASNWGG